MVVGATGVDGEAAGLVYHYDFGVLVDYGNGGGDWGFVPVHNVAEEVVGLLG